MLCTKESLKISPVDLDCVNVCGNKLVDICLYVTRIEFGKWILCHYVFEFGEGCMVCKVVCNLGRWVYRSVLYWPVMRDGRV